MGAVFTQKMRSSLTRSFAVVSSVFFFFTVTRQISVTFKATFTSSGDCPILCHTQNCPFIPTLSCSNRKGEKKRGVNSAKDEARLTDAFLPRLPRHCDAEICVMRALTNTFGCAPFEKMRQGSVRYLIRCCLVNEKIELKENLFQERLNSVLLLF